MSRKNWDPALIDETKKSNEIAKDIMKNGEVKKAEVWR